MPGADTISIRKADSNELELLYATCRQCYSENFADQWESGGLEYYLDLVYGLEPIRSDLSNPNINYFLAIINDEPIGFLKLHLNSNLPNHPLDEGMEIEKIYFLRKHKGKGFGKQLIKVALDMANQLDKKIIWLTALDSNISSIAFYQKLGFKYHSPTRVDFPYFKDELRGMWRMLLDLKS